MSLNQSKGRFLKWWVVRWLPTLPGFYKPYSLLYNKSLISKSTTRLFTLLLPFSLSRASRLSWGQISHIYLYSSLCGDKLLFRHVGSNWVSFTYTKIQTLASLALHEAGSQIVFILFFCLKGPPLVQGSFLVVPHKAIKGNCRAGQTERCNPDVPSYWRSRHRLLHPSLTWI